MKLSLHLAYWGVGAGPDELAPIAREAERLGLDGVWVGEAYGSDVVSSLTWIAAATSTIRLGTAVAQMPARSAAATAMFAASVDTLSDGRLTLGVGPSGPQVSAGWHGVPFARQLDRTRDYVAAVRRALAREPLVADGPTLTLPADGQRPLKLIIGPRQDQVQVYVPSIGPKATRLVGEIADGWLPIFIAPEHLERQRSLLDEGIAAAGRARADVAIAPTAYGRIDDHRDRARDALRDVTALYAGGMGSRSKNFYNDLMASYGFEDAARQVQDLYLDGRPDEAAAALPAELLDLVSLCGTEDDVARRLADHAAAGVDELLVSIVADGLDDRLDQVRRLARARDRAAALTP